MAQWQRHLQMHPEWGMAQEDEMTPQALAAVIAKRLAALAPFGIGIGRTIRDFDDERDELVEAFEDFSRDDSASVNEFDGLMSDLYDWGDQSLDDAWNGKKVCWIDTVGVRAPASQADREFQFRSETR